MAFYSKNMRRDRPKYRLPDAKGSITKVERDAARETWTALNAKFEETNEVPTEMPCVRCLHGYPGEEFLKTSGIGAGETKHLIRNCTKCMETSIRCYDAKNPASDRGKAKVVDVDIKEKKCGNCGATLPIEDFPFGSSKVGGRRLGTCARCLERIAIKKKMKEGGEVSQERIQATLPRKALARPKYRSPDERGNITTEERNAATEIWFTLKAKFDETKEVPAEMPCVKCLHAYPGTEFVRKKGLGMGETIFLVRICSDCMEKALKGNGFMLDKKNPDREKRSQKVEKTVTEKKCGSCKRTLPIAQFPIGSSKVNGCTLGTCVRCLERHSVMKKIEEGDADEALVQRYKETHAYKALSLIEGNVLCGCGCWVNVNDVSDRALDAREKGVQCWCGLRDEYQRIYESMHWRIDENMNNHDRRKINRDKCEMIVIPKEYVEREIIKPCITCGTTDEPRTLARICAFELPSETNLAPSCRFCSIMRGGMDINTFVSRCAWLVQYWLDETKEIPTDIRRLFPNSKAASYEMYKSTDIKCGREFNMSREFFYTVSDRKCHYCGKKPSNVHTNGLDRINSDGEHTRDNCVACCSECNYMKMHFSLSRFRDTVTKISRGPLSEKCVPGVKFHPRCFKNKN